MSITSRINEMSSHIEQAYDELQGLGADLTNVNKNIENISMVLDDIYDSMPQVSGEGTSLTLDDTRVGKIKSTLKGNTSQTTYSGKNLLNNTLLTTTVTRNGITATPHSDGSITFNGTATTLSFFNLSQQDFGENGFNSETGGAGLYVATDGGTLRMAYDPSNHYTYIQVNNGASLNNVIIYPMIRLKTITDDTYEPFVGGTASPNPTYPQPINVVSGDNEIRVQGKNIAYMKNGTYTYGNNTGVITDNSIFTLNSNGTGSNSYFSFANGYTREWAPENSIAGINDMNLTTNGGQYNVTVITNATMSSSIIAIYFWSSTGRKFFTQISSNTTTTLSISLNDNEHIKDFGIWSASGNVFTNYIIKVQLEKGSSSSTYEPYQGNTYNIDLPVENLFDKSTATLNKGVSSSTGNLYNSSDSFATDYIPIQNGKSYTMNSYSSSNVCFGALYDSSKAFLEGFTTSQNNKTVTINNANAKYIRITGQKVNIDTYQLEKGSKANSYTPYGTTPIEMCKIGNYQDYFYKDSGKWYLHKEIGKYTFAGSETFNKVSEGYYMLFSGLSSSNRSVLCNDYTNYTSYSPFANSDYGISFLYNTTQCYIRDKNVSTGSALATKLANNNVYLYYALATPTNTEITYQPLIDQLNLLEKAMSKDGQTNISQVNNDLPFIISASALKEWSV